MRWCALLVAVTGCGFHPTELPTDASGTGTDAHDAARHDAALHDALPHDAPHPIDAPAALDAAPMQGCPSGYAAVNGLTSRYRVVNNDDRPWHEAEAACELDRLVGGQATHLVVIDSAAEASAIANGLSGLAAFNDYWTGMIQPLGSGSKTAGWMWVTGAAGISSRWALAEPDDGNGLASEDDREQFASTNPLLYLDDRPGTQHLRRICECDNAPVDASVPVPP